MKQFKLKAIVGVLALSVVLSACGLWRGQKSPQEIIVNIPHGSSSKQIAEILTNYGLIKSPYIFRIYAKLSGNAQRLQAGEYAFTRQMSLRQILKIIASGQTVRHKVTIPEGYNLKEVAELFARVGLVDEDSFLKAARDTQFLASLGITAPTAEGYLFPSTYFLPKEQNVKEIIREMVRNLRGAFNIELQARARVLGWSELQVLTFASIVEKETGATAERPIIASVFYNRLKRGMRLQSDPTTIYGIANFNGNLTRKDLEAYSPYNTYVIPALPPGPISNPGKAAIQATLFPATTDYLYFVSRNDGTHIFAKTFKEHDHNVDVYQRHRRQHATKK